MRFSIAETSEVQAVLAMAPIPSGDDNNSLGINPNRSRWGGRATFSSFRSANFLSANKMIGGAKDRENN
jgi:hypothetical protein